MKYFSSQHSFLLSTSNAFTYMFSNHSLFCAGLSLSITNVVAGQPLWFLLWLQEALSNNHQEALKGQVSLLTSPGNYTAHLGPHSKVSRKEGEAHMHEGVCRLRVLLLLGKGWLSRPCFLVNLKHMSWNFKDRKRKNKRHKRLLKLTKISKTKEPKIWG